jgi:hypothetical protein
MKNIDLSDDLDALQAFAAQLKGLTEDIDRRVRPVTVRLAGKDFPGSDRMCEKLEATALIIEELTKIVSGVQDAGRDEGALLYWEFELSESRTEEQAIAAMRDAFGSLELERVLPLYLQHKHKIAAARGAGPAGPGPRGARGTGIVRTHQPWWQVRPGELARRYGCDSDRLHDAVDPDDLSDWQFDLVMAALTVCEETMASIKTPEE